MIADPPIVRRVACPACAGSLAPEGASRVVRCAACGVACAVDFADAVPREHVPPTIRASAAIAAAKEALRRADRGSSTADLAEFGPPVLWYAPVFVVEGVSAARAVHLGVAPAGGSLRSAQFVGAAGVEVRVVTWQSGRSAVPTRDTRIVLRDVRHVGLAADLSAWGVALGDLAWDEAAVVSGPPADGLALTPQVAVDAMLETARTAGGMLPAGSRAILVDVETRIVFVPVWAVRFRVGGRPYALRVHGVSGRVLAGRAPVGVERSVLGALVAAAYVGFPLGKLAATRDFALMGELVRTTLGAVVSSPILVIAALGLALLPLAASWSAARYAAEIEFRRGEPNVIELARPPSTRIERIVDALFRFVDRSDRGDER